MKKASKRILILLCVVLVIGALVLLLPMKTAQAGSQTFFVPDETKPTPINFQNGSFQTPTIDLSVNYPDPYQTFQMAQVPGWSTYPANSAYVSDPKSYYIEYRKVDAAGAYIDTNGDATTEANGDQYAELNCYYPGILYQNSTTTPGYKIYWQFAHRARRGVGNLSGTGLDVMNFYLVPGGYSSGTPSSSSLITTASDNALDWYYYRGAYTVPSGQNTTGFAFQSVSTATGTLSRGNFLDDISLQTASKLIAKSWITTSAADNSTAYKGEVVTVYVAMTNWGETDASKVGCNTILSDNVDYVSGSATINGVPAESSLITYFSTNDSLFIGYHPDGGNSIASGVLKGSKSMGTSGTTGQGETVVYSFQLRVTGNVGNLVKSQAYCYYEDKDFTIQAGSGYMCYSSVQGRTVSSGDETSYVNRFSIIGASISGRAWNDNDADGVLDTGETLLSGLTVGAYLSTDTTYSSPVSTATTNASGAYTLSNVPLGTYNLAITTPNGLVATRLQNDNDAIPSGTRAVVSNNTVSTSTPTLTNRDFGFTTNRTVSGRVWYDTDTDGTIDTGEARVSGLTVGIYQYQITTYTTPWNNLYGTALTTTTASDGTYTLSYVPYGTYDIVVTTPNGYIVTRYANDNNAIPSGTKAVIDNIGVLTAAVNNMDFGFTVSRSISGRVWYDADTDGTVDTAETRASGLTVGVYASTDTTYTTPVTNIYGVALTTTTSATGTYSFASVPYGTYKLVVTTPGESIVTILANDNDAVASGTRAIINNVALTTATSVTNQDFGFALNRTISGTVWTDLDWDGMLETGETRVSGLTVGVYPNAATTYTTPVNDLYGAPLTTTTDANGAYSFSQIPYGSYKVAALTPDHHIVTLKTASTDNDALADSANAVISGIDLTAALTAVQQDIGFAVIRSINGRVWADTNWDGMIDSAEKRLSGMTVSLYSAGDTTYTTPINGIYGSPLIAATNASGEYNLNGVPQGSYQIVMTTPDGLKVTLKTASTDNDAVAADSRAIVSDISLTGTTVSVDNMDFGYSVVPTASKNARLNAEAINNGTPSSPVEASLNDTITYTIEIGWNDAYALADIGTVDISDALPAGLKLVTDSSTYTPGMTWSTDTATGITTVFWEDVPVTSAQHAFHCQATVKTVTEGATETLYVNTANVTAGTTQLTTNSTYHRVGTKSITISKIVKGNLADPKEEFSFRITLNDVGGTLAYTGASTITGVNAPPDGTIASGFAILPLKHGQSITIDKVPIGSSYVISEVLIFSGYQLAITETNGGSFTPVGNAGAGGTITGDVSLQFENTLIGTVPTGILLQIYPYALMAILAGGVLTLSLSLARHKKRSRNRNAKRY